MNLDQLAALVERLRKEAIGDPAWIPGKGVFEYEERSAKVVAVLKLVRAMHGVSAFELLRAQGLFIDGGAIMRCIGDCSHEIHFLLENYPKTSTKVDRFVAAFFAGTVDAFLVEDASPIPTKEVRSATVRYLKGRHDDMTQKMLQRVFKAFSGYVHANYAHIMEVYGSRSGFNLRGVPSAEEKLKRLEFTRVAATYVVQSGALIAGAVGLTALRSEFLQMDRS